MHRGDHPYGCLSGAISLEEENVALRFNSRGLPAVVIPDLVRPEPFVINVDATMRDFAVVRKDGTPAYQLACVVDDFLWDVNIIGRGQDLLPSTAAQIVLSDAIGYPPLLGRARFLHHPLLRGADGEKISKSAGHQGRPHPFAAGTVAELRGLVAGWLGGGVGV